MTAAFVAVALTSAGLAVIPGGAALATASGDLGTAQRPTVLFTEDFENGVGAAPVGLERYTGVDGATYSADGQWLNQFACNGTILSYGGSVSVPCAGRPGPFGPLQEAELRRQAYALGQISGSATPESNHSLSEYTQYPGASYPQAGSAAPPNAVEFRSSQIKANVKNRFITFSVDVVASSCTATDQPELSFSLVDGAGAEVDVTGQSAINPCSDPRARSISPPLTPQRTGDLNSVYRGGNFASSGSVLYSGSSLGILMRNQTGGGTGNDHSIDNIRILDVTPQLDKSFSPASLVVNDVSTLTFTVTNTSELAAKNGWSFTDALPDGLTIAAGAPSTTCPAGVVTGTEGATSIATSGNLDAGMQSCTFSVPVTATRAGSYTNGPENVTGVGVNPPGDSTVVFQKSAPALTVVKSASPDTAASFTVGQRIEYTFVVTNAGNVPLADVAIDEGAFSGAGPLTSAVCPAGILAVGAETTCTTSYELTQADVDSGHLTNSATATGTPPTGSRPVSPPSEVTVPGDQHAALSVLKSVTPATAGRAGDLVTYSFVVTNTGNVTLSDIAIDEAAFSGSGHRPVATCPAKPLGPAQTSTCTASYQLTQADVDSGVVSNTATAQGTPPSGGPPVHSEPSEAVVDVPSAPAMTVVKSADSEARASITAGQEIRYSFLVTNTGNVTLTNSTIDEGTFSGTGTLSSPTCPAGASTLAPAAQMICTATYRVSQADVDSGTITNAAKATAQPPAGPPVVSPPSEVRVPASTDGSLSIVKTASSSFVSTVGATITYTFLLTNTGGVTLDHARVVEGEFSGTGALSSPVCEAGADSLGPGAQTVCTATYVVTKADLSNGGIVNSATASAHGPDGGSIVSDSSTARVRALAPAPSPGLAATGTDAATWSKLALLLLLGGGVAFAMRSTRRRT